MAQSNKGLWIIAVVLFVVGLPILACAGCLVLGLAISPATKQSPSVRSAPKNVPPEASTESPNKKDRYDIYAAVDDTVCATDKNFLDSSPLASPANFARVAKGTEVVIVDIGGVFAGKMYYGLSAGGRQRIYVYRADFEQKFTKVKTIEK